MPDVSPLRYVPPPPAPRPYQWPPPSVPSDSIHPVPSQSIGPGGMPVPVVQVVTIPPVTTNGNTGTATFTDGVLTSYQPPT
jgi:hypothetical protein